jgi:hypothetical protein
MKFVEAACSNFKFREDYDFQNYAIINVCRDGLNYSIETNMTVEEKTFVEQIRTRIANASSHTISAVQCAAAITAYSRNKVYKQLQKKQEHLFYTDTDSFFYSSEIDPKDVSSSILGKWKEEDSLTFASENVCNNKKIIKMDQIDLKCKGTARRYQFYA